MSPERSAKKQKRAKLESNTSRFNLKTISRRLIFPAVGLVGLGLAAILYRDYQTPASDSTYNDNLADKLHDYDLQLTAHPNDYLAIESSIAADMARIYCQDAAANCDPKALASRVSILSHRSFKEKYGVISNCRMDLDESTQAQTNITTAQVYIDADKTIQEELTTSSPARPATYLAEITLHELGHSEPKLITVNQPIININPTNGQQTSIEYFKGFGSLVRNSSLDYEGLRCYDPLGVRLEEAFVQSYTEKSLRANGIPVAYRIYSSGTDAFDKEILNKYFQGDIVKVLRDYHRTSDVLGFLRKIGEANGYSGDEAARNGTQIIANIFNNLDYTGY